MNLPLAIFLTIFVIASFAAILTWYRTKDSEAGAGSRPAVDSFIDSGDAGPIHFDTSRRAEHPGHHHDSGHDFGGHSGGHDSFDGGPFDGGHTDQW